MKLEKDEKSSTEPLVPVSKTAGHVWPNQRLQHEIYRLFEERFNNWLYPNKKFVEDWMPAINVYEEKGAFVVEAELPGMKKDEIEIYMAGNTLNVIGKRQSEHEDASAEQSFGHFHHQIAIPLPVNAGKISAQYIDGVLTITCPKAKGARRKLIQIKVD